MIFKVGNELFDELGKGIPSREVKKPALHTLANFAGSILGLDVFMDPSLNPTQWKILDSNGKILFDSSMDEEKDNDSLIPKELPELQPFDDGDVTEDNQI